MIDLQVSNQRVKIFRDGAGLRAGVWVGGATAPSSPVKCDGPVARLDKRRNIVLKTVGVAGVGVKQHDGNAGAAAVRVPEAHAGKIRMSGELCSSCHNQKPR